MSKPGQHSYAARRQRIADSIPGPKREQIPTIYNSCCNTRKQ